MGREVSLTHASTPFALLRIRLTIAESGDIVAKNRRLPAIEPDNVAAVLNSGAYGFSMSCQYNGRVMCTEVLVNGSRVDGAGAVHESMDCQIISASTEVTAPSAFTSAAKSISVLLAAICRASTASAVESSSS